jgi:hypothetical protein
MRIETVAKAFMQIREGFKNAPFRSLLVFESAKDQILHKASLIFLRFPVLNRSRSNRLRFRFALMLDKHQPVSASAFDCISLQHFPTIHLSLQGSFLNIPEPEQGASATITSK